MGFEQTIAEYREAKGTLVEEGDKEFIRSTALQKAWADRICEALPEKTNEEIREATAVDTVEALGQWFRENVLEFPAKPNTVSRKQYYLNLFDQDPRRAVEELYVLYRGGLH